MNAILSLRIIGLLEGLSFLVLLFIAMPLKYIAGHPDAVRVVGSIHGALFLLFLAAVFWVALERDWPLRRSLLAVIASFLPFGTFALDGTLKREARLGQ
jgi:integral membrane protein